MGKVPVTQIRWEAVMEENPSKFRGNDHPVSNVSWFQAQEFIKMFFPGICEAYAPLFPCGTGHKGEAEKNQKKGHGSVQNGIL